MFRGVVSAAVPSGRIMPIARTWSGATRAADADAYLEYLHETGLKEYAATPGNEGVLCLRRIAGDRAEFTLVTLWRDRRAIEHFAGPRVDRAVFYPEDDAFLVRRDETAAHHEVVFAGPPRDEPGPETASRRVRDRLRRGAAVFVGWWSEHARRGILPGVSPPGD